MKWFMFKEAVFTIKLESEFVDRQQKARDYAAFLRAKAKGL